MQAGWRRWLCWSIALIASLSLSLLLPAHAQESSFDRNPRSSDIAPDPQVHPLPASLDRWQAEDQGDYFEQIEPTAAGYLIWSRFPIRVFVEPSDRSNWVNAVQQAIAEWTVYLPLVEVDRAETADIAIWCRTPPLQWNGGELGRARSAETRFEVGIDRSTAPAILAHRLQLWLRPDQSAIYLQAAARHELGHALGIWGHSLEPTDAMYFSQVGNPPLISVRDVNTLKRIYQQPTRLGWAVRQSR